MSCETFLKINPQTDRLHKEYLCETEGDLPDSGLTNGEIAIIKNSQKVFIADSSVWVEKVSVTWPSLAPDGTAEAPSYSFVNDPDTGMYRGGTNTLKFATNGINRAIINNSGFVGIGTENPSRIFQVSDDFGVDLPALRISGSGARWEIFNSSAPSDRRAFDMVGYETDVPGDYAWWWRGLDDGFSSAPYVWAKLGYTAFEINPSPGWGIPSTDMDFIVHSLNQANALFVDGNNGRVGIGTIAPEAKLHVATSENVNTQSARFHNPDLATDGFYNYISIGKTMGANNAFEIGYRYDTTPGNEGGWLSVSGDSVGIGIFIKKGGNVGFGTIEPNVSCDVNGGLALRVGAITLGNGQNHNIAIGNRSFIRVTGPTASFTLTGFANGYDGKLLVVYNATAQNMTIANENANSSAANRIRTLTGGNVTLSGTSSVTFIYSSTDSRWIFIGERI